MIIEYYSEMLKDIGRKDSARANKLLAKEKIIVKVPTYQELEIKEIQTDPRDYEQIRRYP
jgi:hypothetical protein